MSELIEGIKLYQDEEYKYMQAEFERVEQLLANANRPHTQQDNQTQFVMQTNTIENRYCYAKWILLFFLIFVFGLMMRMYLGRFTDTFVAFWDSHISKK